MFTLAPVVPWRRSFDEYQRMFSLGREDLKLRIIGCGDGPASFNAEATRRGVKVVPCDPIYRFGKDEIQDRIEAAGSKILSETRRNADQFVWTTVRSIDELRDARMKAMERFLKDFEIGESEARYMGGAELPNLPFGDASFGLALCSHFLFLYSAQLGLRFHEDAILEMCRVAREVRIFPLLALGGRRSNYVDLVGEMLDKVGCAVSIETVAYEFQRGGNQMMRIRRRHECS